MRTRSVLKLQHGKDKCQPNISDISAKTIVSKGFFFVVHKIREQKGMKLSE